MHAHRLATGVSRLANRRGARAAVRRLPWPPRRAGALLFHHVAPAESSWTAGLGVTTSPDYFAERLRYGLRHHRFVDLDGFLGDTGAGGRRPMLLTFDDAYASVRRVAAPICRSLGVPALFFVNGRFVDNRELALDNLVAHIVNTQGFAPVVRAAGRQLRSLEEVLSVHVPTLSLPARHRFEADLTDRAGVDPAVLLSRERPYVTAEDLAELREFEFEIGNHTASHVHCRILDAAGVEEEIVGNRQLLEQIVGGAVRAFAFPYGSCADATPDVVTGLRESGHRTAFVVHGRHNRSGSDPYRRPRISLRPAEGHDPFVELEVLPRLRALRPLRAAPSAAPQTAGS